MSPMPRILEPTPYGTEKSDPGLRGDTSRALVMRPLEITQDSDESNLESLDRYEEI
jgi:hypothetical protein